MTQERNTISQPISFLADDLAYLKRKAARTGLGLSSLVRQYVRAEREACGDINSATPPSASIVHTINKPSDPASIIAPPVNPSLTPEEKA